MSGKTKVVLKSQDGRTFAKEFDSYQAAVAWVYERTAMASINLELVEANFEKEPTIEVYKESAK